MSKTKQYFEQEVEKQVESVLDSVLNQKINEQKAKEKILSIQGLELTGIDEYNVDEVIYETIKNKVLH